MIMANGIIMQLVQHISNQIVVYLFTLQAGSVQYLEKTHKNLLLVWQVYEKKKRYLEFNESLNYYQRVFKTNILRTLYQSVSDA